LKLQAFSENAPDIHRMERLPRDLFPPDLKRAIITLLGEPVFAAILLKQPPDGSVLGCFPAEFAAVTSLLHPNELAKIDHYRLAKRRSEFLTGRICAKMALESLWTAGDIALPPLLSEIDITHDPSGRPIVFRHDLERGLHSEISITHGGEYAAALAAELPCGIDIQPQKDNLLRVREKYCSLKEIEVLAELLPGAPLLTRLSLLWAAKEAAKKALSYLQMPGFLELELTRPANSSHQCHSFTLAVRVRNNRRMPDTVTVLATTFENYGVAICLLTKEQCYA